MPFTWWELCTMLEGKRDEQWNHTAAIRADILNCHLDPKRTQAYDPDDLRPTYRRERCEDYEDFSLFKEIITQMAEG